MPPTFIWAYILILACIWRAAEANTEIVNVEAVDIKVTANDIPPPWEALSAHSPAKIIALKPAPLGTPIKRVCEAQAGGPERLESSENAPPFRISDCPHESWITLDLDAPLWKSFQKFTLRISWPANHPVDFLIEALPPSAIPSLSERPEEVARNTTERMFKSRRQYARIRAVDTGVRPLPFAHLSPAAVPFTLLLEPLYLGVLPASVVPVLELLLAVILIAEFFVAPRVHHHISQVAQDIRNRGATHRKEK